jgi:hypothetical protein
VKNVLAANSPIDIGFNGVRERFCGGNLLTIFLRTLAARLRAVM